MFYLHNGECSFETEYISWKRKQIPKKWGVYSVASEHHRRWHSSLLFWKLKQKVCSGSFGGVLGDLPLFLQRDTKPNGVSGVLHQGGQKKILSWMIKGKQFRIIICQPKPQVTDKTDLASEQLFNRWNCLCKSSWETNPSVKSMHPPRLTICNVACPGYLNPQFGCVCFLVLPS